MASQLEVQLKLNEAIKARTALLKEQSDVMKSQISQAAGLSKAWEGAAPGDVVDAIEKMNKALAEASAKASETAAATESIGRKSVRSLLKTREPLSSMRSRIDLLKKSWLLTTAAVTGFVDGLVAGTKFVFNSLTSVLGLVTSIASGFANVTLEILKMPFNSLSALIAVSNKLAAIMQAIAEATEQVRKQFGELSTGPGQAVKEMAADVGKGFEKLRLGGYTVFGNLAERIAHVNQVATEMGAVFDSFRQEMVKDKGASLLLQRGLGLTGETLGAVGKRAKAMGTTLVQQLKSMTKFAVDFGRGFGLSSKTISRDMGDMVKDVRNFGNMGPRELAKISVYARKLGVDVKDLLGVIDKFDTFEDAATSAAMLSQAFGANTDAIKLMKAESPAERVDELRRAFFAAGKSADTLTRQELKLLAQTTGLDEAAARTVFSQKNMGVSMANLEKQGKISEQRQLSTSEAVQQLASSIERTIKPFRQFVSFLQAFADGFARGIFQGKGVRAMLTAIYNALRQTYRIGIAVGEAFDQIFPGVQQVAGAIHDLFDLGSDEKPGAFKKFLLNVKSSFLEFFQAVAGDNPRSLPNLIKRLRHDFFSWLDPRGRGIVFIDGFKKFAGALGNIASGMVDVLSDGIVNLSNVLIGLMSGKGLPKLNGMGIADKFLGPVAEALEKNWPRVRDAFKNLWDVAWPKVQAVLDPMLKVFGMWALTTIFGAAFIKSATSVIATAIGRALLSAATTSAAGGSFTTAFGGLGTTIASVIFNPTIWIPAAIAAAAVSMVGVANGIDKYQPTLEKRLGKGLRSTFASAVAGIADTVSFGMLGDTIAMGIGESIAAGAAHIGAAFESLFGENAYRAIKMWMGEVIGIFAEGGKLIRAVFSGDIDGAIDATLGLGKKFGKFFAHILTDYIPGIVTGFFNFVKNSAVAAFGIIDTMVMVTIKTSLKIIEKFIDVLGSQVEKLPGMLQGPFKSLLGGIQSFLPKSENIVFKSGVESSKALAAGIEKGAKDYAPSFDFAASALDNAETQASRLQSVQEKTMMGPWRDGLKATQGLADQMLKEADEVGKAQGAADVVINAKLKRLGDTMGLKDNELTIKHKDMKLLVNLNVTLEAGELAEVLAEHGIVSVERTTRG